jgi:DNA transposition AAA+ family ATPase
MRNYEKMEPSSVPKETKAHPPIGEQADSPESLVDIVKRVMASDRLTQNTVRTESGVGLAVLNQWLQRKYRGDVASIDRRMVKWLETRGLRASMSSLVPGVPAFFESETAQKITSHLQFAHSLGDILVVFGLPGVGKTSSIREYQRSFSNIWIATMSPAITRTMAVLQEIAFAVGATSGSLPARRLAKSIETKIRGTGGLLIIDEAHHISVLALDVIRSLHDSTGIGIALVGGVELETKLQGMPQFYSRVGLRIYVTKVLAGDVNAQLDAWKITKPDTRRFLSALSTKPGGLRGVTKVLQLASVLSSTSNEGLDLKHIKDAAATLAPQATGEE